MDEPHARHSGWITAFQIGGYSFPATIVLTALAFLVSLAADPVLTFVFGRGWGAPLAVALLLFFLLLLFRKALLSRVYNPPSKGDEALLEYFVQQNTGSGAEEEIAAALLENALQLKAVRAHDCMSPRPEIIYVDIDAPVSDLQQLFMESGLSRILVTEGDLDNIKGYVHVQQLLNRPDRIRSIVMPITFVPETIAVNDLLHKLIRTRTSIACVVDEYGSLEGLVTLEDALEQLFGEIDDEHDQEEFIEVQHSETEFLFSGRLKVDYLNEKYPGLNIPSGDYNTLSGYLVTTTETIPEQGVRLALDGKTFILELVSDRKIETVRVLL
ncbi:MAG: HlyC/CorC family transporter [Bacteroidetes bacterium]|nr:MAG: HlyC/CorC family transporter [Bacteroidota bacterium]